MNELRFETIIAASPASVFDCWTTSALVSTWACQTAVLQAQPGGAYSLLWDGRWASGVYSAVEDNTRLAFSWTAADAPGATEVDVSLAAEADGTRLVLTHGGFGSGGDWDAHRDSLHTFWADALDNLRVTAETGADRRFLQRPLIGTSQFPINPGYAAEHGLPFQKAMHLTIVPENTPGWEAGLRAGDYLVEIDGVNVGDFGSFLGAIGRHKAGDTVDVTYYRGGAMHTASVTFAKREPQVYPQTREALYEAVSARVAGIEDDLEGLIAGATREALAAKPSPTEWSANETLAHMVWAERWYQQVLWILMTTGEVIPWGENNRFQLDGILATHPDGVALMAELRRTLREQVEMIHAIPDATLAVRPLYNQIAGVLSLTGEHCRRHYTQIEQAIVQARRIDPASAGMKREEAHG
jgi:uncharacterized protein YndB with AHSA1/START domain